MRSGMKRGKRKGKMQRKRAMVSVEVMRRQFQDYLLALRASLRSCSARTTVWNRGQSLLCRVILESFRVPQLRSLLFGSPVVASFRPPSFFVLQNASRMSKCMTGWKIMEDSSSECCSEYIENPEFGLCCAGLRRCPACQWGFATSREAGVVADLRIAVKECELQQVP